MDDSVAVDPSTGKPVHIRHATPDMLVVVGPDMKTVNIAGKPLTVVAGSVLITPGITLQPIIAHSHVTDYHDTYCDTSCDSDFMATVILAVTVTVSVILTVTLSVTMTGILSVMLFSVMQDYRTI